MTYEHLLVERRGSVAVVTLNRPDRLNALSNALMRELEALALAFREDTETRAIVIAGAGKHFSAGKDLKDPERNAPEDGGLLVRQRQAQLGQRMIAALQAIPQITVAAIQGVALGGGACIVTALDFRVGSQDCAVGYPEINLGMSLSWYGLPLCVRLVGPARAKRMVILGQQETAATLLDWGFLDEVVPRDELMERAMAMAEAYAAKPPLAAQLIKRGVNAISSDFDRAIMHMDTDQLLLTMHSDDHREGIQAFLEKRTPKFRGR